MEHRISINRRTIHRISSRNSLLSIPIKIYLRSSLSLSSKEVFFTPSLNWDTKSRMEIVKQWIPKSSLFQQHDHTTILSLLIFLIFGQSYQTKFTFFLVYLYSLFFYLYSTLMFLLHCMIKILRQMKKNSCIFDESITL